jgi:hypothetical protein
MLTNQDIKNAYLKELYKDEEIKSIIDDLTETIYENLLGKNIYVTLVRYDVETAKKVGFIMRMLGFAVEDYHHGSLHISISQ